MALRKVNKLFGQVFGPKKPRRIKSM